MQLPQTRRWGFRCCTVTRPRFTPPNLLPSTTELYHSAAPNLMRQTLSEFNPPLVPKSFDAGRDYRPPQSALFPPGAECLDLSATKLIQRFYVIQINLLWVRNVREGFGHLVLTQKMYGWIGRAIGEMA